ncbi:MAG: tetratricopeptide repeat protein [Pyrinomonadaceae bacterium]
MRTEQIFRVAFIASLLTLTITANALAQSGSSRPRRVTSATPSSSTSNSTNAPATNPVPTQSAPASSAAPNANARRAASTGGDTTRAYTLLQQKQYAAALKEAKTLTVSDPKNAEGWKIAGFAEMSLAQYAEAAADLQRALDLQRAAKEDDPNTVDALAQALVRTDAFERALPLLVTATSRTGARPDAGLLYLRGLAEYRTGKPGDAERSFDAATRANPKDAASLFYLGRIAYERKDFDKAIAMLNRATLADAREPVAWGLLTTAYLQRAALVSATPNATSAARADADYQSAIRSGETLYRLKPDASSALLYGQVLLTAKRYVPAAAVLERAAAGADASASSLYLLGIAYSRAKNYPKATATLERAAQKSPDDVNIYRELGYDYEISKQYAKALAAYEKGASLAPTDTDFKESVERVRPFAK